MPGKPSNSATTSRPPATRWICWASPAAVCNRRGQSVRDLPQAYPNLRIATRDRDKLVRMRTAVSNRIHSYVDRLFPGFLSAGKSGLEPFCQASLELMEDRFSPAQLRRRPRQSPGPMAGPPRRHSSPRDRPISSSN